MSTRSRTKSMSATNNVKSQSSKDNQLKSIRSRARSLKSEDHMSEMEKETRIGRGKAKTPMKVTQDAQEGQAKDRCTFCICHEPDDGTPMVCCSVCNEWYHFRCVKLDEVEASELHIYVCSTCTELTGQRTVSECHRSFSGLSLHARIPLHVHPSYESCPASTSLSLVAYLFLFATPLLQSIACRCDGCTRASKGAFGLTL
ncbi:hypothetical protein BDR07DRAFT_1282809 [Suillus spraguei]|nr:hypothetical protein BDR07DRAFT_1282809 [Suillus spraguei]